MNRRLHRSLLFVWWAGVSLFPLPCLYGYAQAARAAAAQKPSAEDEAFERMKTEAARARESDRLAEASRIYEQLVKQRPAWAEGWWYLGTLYYEQGQLPAAASAFGKVAALEPENGQAWGLLGISEFQTGEFNLALQHLTKARAAGLGDNHDLARSVRYHQAVLLTRSRQFEEALSILVGFGIEHRESPRVLDALGAASLRIAEPVDQLPTERQEMVRLFGKAAFLAAERKMDESFKLYEELESKYRGQPNVAYVFGVAHLLLKADPDAALPYLKAELERDPTHVPAMMRVAFRMLETNQFDECSKYARRLMELEPENYAGYYLQGRIHLYSQEYSQAITLLERSAFLAPRLAAVQYSLSEAYHRAGRPEDALKAREQFARLNTGETREEAGAPSVLASSQAIPAQGGPGKAAPQPGALPSRPEAPVPEGQHSAGFDRLKLQAERAREKGELPDAIQLYERLVKMRPDWAEGWWYLGSLRYDGDQFAPAAEAFERLLVSDPKNSHAWALLGLCEYRLGRNAAALEHLTKSRQLGVDRFREISRVVRLHQAMLLSRSRQFEAALFVLNTYASEHLDADPVLDAMGMAVLRMPDPVEAVPEAQRPMIRSFGRANYLDAEQRREESFKLYQELEAQYRGQPNVAYAFGAALLTQQEGEKAVGFFRQELERDPKHDAALLQVALQMIALGKFEEGVACAERAIAAAPAHFAGHYALGRSYLYLNNLPQSIAALEKAAELAPTVAILHYTLSQAYQRAGRAADAARARAQFEKVEALNKNRRRDLFISPEDVLPAPPGQPDKQKSR